MGKSESEKKQQNLGGLSPKKRHQPENISGLALDFKHHHRHQLGITASPSIKFLTETPLGGPFFQDGMVMGKKYKYLNHNIY